MLKIISGGQTGVDRAALDADVEQRPALQRATALDQELAAA